MKCPACGTEQVDGAKVCGACGMVLDERVDAPALGGPPAEGSTEEAGQTQAPAAGTASASVPLESLASNPQVAEITKRTRSGLIDGWSAFRRLATDPVGQLIPVADDLGLDRARTVGLVYGVTFTVALWLGFTIALRRLFSNPLLGYYGAVLGSNPAGSQLKLLIFGLVPFVSLVAACFLARAAFRSTGRGLGGDIYYVGVALMPFAVFFVLSGILGAAVPELVVALLIVAMCLHVLILFRGSSEIGALGDQRASLAVPLMLLVAAWISSVILRSMLL